MGLPDLEARVLPDSFGNVTVPIETSGNFADISPAPGVLRPVTTDEASRVRAIVAIDASADLLNATSQPDTEFSDVKTQPIPIQLPHFIVETDTFTPGLIDTKPITLPTVEELEGAQNA